MEERKSENLSDVGVGMRFVIFQFHFSFSATIATDIAFVVLFKKSLRGGRR